MREGDFTKSHVGIGVKVNGLQLTQMWRDVLTIFEENGLYMYRMLVRIIRVGQIFTKCAYSMIFSYPKDYSDYCTPLSGNVGFCFSRLEGGHNVIRRNSFWGRLN